jgi:hypothetical protein
MTSCLYDTHTLSLPLSLYVCIHVYITAYHRLPSQHSHVQRGLEVVSVAAIDAGAVDSLHGFDQCAEGRDIARSESVYVCMSGIHMWICVYVLIDTNATGSAHVHVYTIAANAGV